jgi:hypothetical protein
MMPKNLEFVRNPHNPGLNKWGDVVIFQHTLATIGHTQYLTIDVDAQGNVEFQKWAGRPVLNQDIEWHN